MLRPGNPVEDHGQPRPEVAKAPGLPTAAERARTLVEGNSSALLVIPGLPADGYPMMPEARHTDRAGDVLLRMPVGSPALRAASRARDAELVAMLELTDVAPVAVPRRIRGRAEVAGWLTAHDRGEHAGWLRLEVGEVAVDDLWGAERVEPTDFARATPDPLASREAELLQHLAASHPGQLALLGALVECPERCAAAGPPVPVALDRLGLRVRFSGPGGTFDARFDFEAPVGELAELRRAMHGLFDAARRCAD
jgi:hypothetical protein